MTRVAFYRAVLRCSRENIEILSAPPYAKNEIVEILCKILRDQRCDESEKKQKCSAEPLSRKRKTQAFRLRGTGKVVL